jgi:hypothetical protein
MPLRVTCPGCKTAFVCPDDYVGKRLQCQQCRQQFIVGGARPAAPPPAPPPANPKPPSAVRPAAPPKPRPAPQVTTDVPAAPPKRGAAPAPAAGPPKKKSRRGLVVGLLAAVVLVPLLCCGLPAFGAWWWFWRAAPTPTTAPAAEEQAGEPAAPEQPAKNGFDTSFLTADFNFALVARPARLLKSPLMAVPLAPLLQDPGFKRAVEETGVDPMDLQQVVVAFEPVRLEELPPRPGGGLPREEDLPLRYGMIFRFGKPVDVRKVIATTPGGVEEQTFQGKTYLKAKAPDLRVGGQPICGYVAEGGTLAAGRTFVVAPEATLLKMLSAGAARSPLIDRLRAADIANNDAVAVVVMGPYRPLLTQAVAAADKSLPPQLAGVRNLPEHLQSVTATVNLTGPALLKITLEADNAEGAAKVEELAKSALDFARQIYPEVRKGLAPQLPAGAAKPVLAVVDQFNGGVKLAKEGANVTLTLPRPAGLDAKRKEPPSPEGLPGLLTYWPLDGAAGAGATAHGGKWVEGVRGKALELDGANDYVDLGAAAALNFKAGAPFTVAGWVRTKRPSGTVLSLRHSKDGGALLDLTVAGGRLQAQVREDGKELGEHVVVTGPPVSDGDWHHFALTRVGQSFELYVDGDASAQGTGRDAGGPITTDLRALGSERAWAQRGVNPPEQRFLQGALDEVCVFGRALSAAEVKKLAGVAP